MSAGRLGRREALTTALLGAGFGLLYLRTLCPTVFWYDSAEYVTAAVTLGIPHPPGYPLYTLLAHVFTWLPLPPAAAVNAMSAAFAALAVALLHRVGLALRIGPLGAAVAALTLGGSALFWENAVIAEVYCPALAVLAAVLLLLLRGRATGELRWTLAAALVAGLGLGIHLSVATCGLGLAFWVLAGEVEVRSPAQLRRLFAPDKLRAASRRGAAALGATLLGSMIFLYLPLRAASRPALNFGDPSTPGRFLWLISGGNYKHWFVAVDPLERAGYIASNLGHQLGLLAPVLALLGLLRLLRRRPVDALALILAAAGNLCFFFDYRVHDLEVFFLPTTLVLALLAGCGAPVVADAVGRAVSAGGAGSMGRLVAGALLAGSLSLVPGHYREADRSAFDETDRFIAASLETLPRGAVIVTYTTPPEWKLDAVFGMYVQKVLGRRRDVQILSLPSTRTVVALLRAGRAVYAYADMSPVVRGLDFRAEGPLFRVRGPGSDGGLGARGRPRRGRRPPGSAGSKGERDPGTGPRDGEPEGGGLCSGGSGEDAGAQVRSRRSKTISPSTRKTAA